MDSHLAIRRKHRLRIKPTNASRKTELKASQIMDTQP